MKIENNKNKFAGEKISRKDAIKKAGITALTTASLMFLQTKAHATDSANRAQDLGTGRGGR